MTDSISRRVIVCFLAGLLSACGGGGGGEGGAEGRVGVGEHAGGQGGDEGGGEGSEGGGEHRGGGDGEGEGEGGGDGNGHEGGGTGSGVPFVSSGQSRGVFESLILLPDEAYAGLLNDTEIAISHDPDTGRFFGRLRNEATTAVCDVRAAAELDGFQVVNRTLSGNEYVLDGLRPYDEAEFEFPLDPGTTFSEWVVTVETSECSSAPLGTGGGGEGGSGEGPGEHPGEGGEGEGHEGGGDGEEDAPTIPIAEVASGTFGSSEYSFLFDMADMAFRGTVTNSTNRFICASRTEIHMGIGGMEVVELGPTIPVNLSPGETASVVMSAPDYMPDTYAVHPESSACP